MAYDFDGKRFRVVVNEGPAAAVTTETVFEFRQVGDIVHADYHGGGVRFGKLLGRLDGDRLRHRYIQINTQGEFQAGQGDDEIRRSADGRIQLIDAWEWTDGRGRGQCVMEEL